MPTRKKSSARPASVPRTTEDPIQYLMDRGNSPTALAIEWGFAFSDSVYRLKRFEYVPKYESAKKMAVTLGWSSAGQVMDFWSARVEAKRESA